MLNDTFDIRILANGRPLPTYKHQGKTYVAAPEGAQYEIEVIVPDFGRYAAIASVDGLSVMTGKRATSNDSGYLVQKRIKIPGFLS